MLNNDNPLLRDREDAGNEAPLLCGSFTDWKHKQMMTLNSFLMLNDKTDISVFLDQLKESGVCRGVVESEKDMS